MGVQTDSEESIVFPRLVYIGDIPIEPMRGGSALIYRLLDEYPSDRLLILQTSEIPLKGDRLTSIKYERVFLEGQRLCTTRLSRLGHSWTMLRASTQVSKVSRLTKSFRPEGVLTDSAWPCLDTGGEICRD